MVFTRVLVSAFLVGGFAASAFGQLTFENPHVVEQGGLITGIAWGVVGGQPFWSAKDGKPIKSSVGVRTIWGIGGNINLSRWIQGNLGGPTTPVSDSFDMYSLVSGQRRLSMGNALLTEVTFPACDANRKEPGGVETTFVPDFIVDQGVATVSKEAKYLVKKQKMWLCSNFRMSLGNLPCSRVSRIEPITVRGAASKGYIDADSVVGDVVFNVPVEDSAPFEEAFTSALLGVAKEATLRLEYLDDDGNLLMALNTVVLITGFGPTDIFGGTAPNTVHAKVVKGNSLSTSPTTGDLEIIIK